MSKTILPILPDEVITDNILIRLPVKSVGRFRCVSKPWRSSLSGTKFARAHFKFHQDREPEGAIVSSMSHDDLTLSQLNFTTESCSATVFWRTLAKLSGSCHGLVLIHQRMHLYLSNPLTLETSYVEPPDLGTHVYSLGYDGSRDDYKIVSLSMNKRHVSGLVHVYSVRGKTWRRWGTCSYGQQFLNGGEFLNGCTHWLFSDSLKLVIVAFNFAREELGTVPPPSNLDYGVVIMRGVFLDFAVVGGCLTVGYGFYSEGRFAIRFWMMKEYGVQDSWTEHTIWWPGDAGINRLSVVGALGEDEFLLRMYFTKFAAYNWRTGIWRDLPFGGITGSVDATMAFRQSLISPNYNVL